MKVLTFSLRHPLVTLIFVSSCIAAACVFLIRSQVASAYEVVQDSLLGQARQVTMDKLSYSEREVWANLRSLPPSQKSIRRVDNISSAVLWVEVLTASDGKYLIEVVDVDASVPSVVAIQKQQ